MSRNIVTQKTSVVKVSGMKDTFRTAKGSLVTYSEILANHTAYDVDGIPSETLAKRAKNAKARKNSRKSATTRQTPRNITDLSLNGESSHTRQANQQGKATAELVSRVNEAEGASPLSLTSSPAPITAKLAGDSVESAPDSIILNNITTEDEWPVVSISFDDEDFCHPDSLGDLWQPQMVQQAQAQALGATALTDSRVEYVVDVAGDSGETVADSAPFYTQAELAQFGEMAEANGHAPTAPDSDKIEIEWMQDAQGDSDGYEFHCHKGTDASGNSYYMTVSEQPVGNSLLKLVALVKVTLPDGREGQADTAEAALAIAQAKPCDWLTLGDFVEADDEWPSSPDPLYPDYDVDDSLGDLITPEMESMWQLQAEGLL